MFLLLYITLCFPVYSILKLYYYTLYVYINTQDLSTPGSELWPGLMIKASSSWSLWARLMTCGPESAGLRQRHVGEGGVGYGSPFGAWCPPSCRETPRWPGIARPTPLNKPIVVPESFSSSSAILFSSLLSAGP